jgi:hypothetical protein
MDTSQRLPLPEAATLKADSKIRKAVTYCFAQQWPHFSKPGKTTNSNIRLSA